jgi:hypothetical protein
MLVVPQINDNSTKNEYMVIMFYLKMVVNWLKQLVKEIITIVILGGK